VIQNVEFGLKLKGMDKERRRQEAMKYVEMVGLKDFADAYPKELSGGMKQRVAIARAYAVNPEVLLMDEPFGALDAQTRAQLQEDLLKTWDKEKKTCFFITHDVDEAVLLAQRVVIMGARPGRIREIINIDVPYPRNQETKLQEDYIAYRNLIWSKVYKEYLEVAK
jgi:NitT/TauT family transport system ATP-binding protein